MGAVSLVNRYSFNIDAESRMLTEGMLWFKDLSAPDPYGVLPIVGSFLIFLNIMMGSTSNISPMMRKMRRYMYVLPILTIPVWMTFPAAFNLYWITGSLF